MMFLPEMNRGVSVKKKERSGLREKMCVWMGGKE